jgi:hypothetical protein
MKFGYQFALAINLTVGRTSPFASHILAAVHFSGRWDPCRRPLAGLHRQGITRKLIRDGYTPDHERVTP